MSMNFEQAIAAVSGSGSPFEIEHVTVGDAELRQFKNGPKTVRDMFDSARDIDATFLVYEDEEWTFKRVMTDVDALAYALVHTFHIKLGDRVGIAMRNLPEWIVSFAAILSVGAISVSLNAWWTEDEIDYAINDAGLSLLIADTERVVRSHGPCERAGIPILGVRLDAIQPLSPHVQSWNDVMVRGVAMPEVDLDPETDATILYTSGTTGFPKGAVSTHRAVTNAILAFASSGAIQTVRRGPGETGGGNPPCFILIVPLFHVTGCIPVMLSCFTWHFKLVMMFR